MYRMREQKEALKGIFDTAESLLTIRSNAIKCKL
jgi:hypothetical protein